MSNANGTLKTYVLLSHTEPNAPIYQRINKNQRVRLNKRKLDHAYLRTTFSDKGGVNRTIRLKLGANSIYQDQQIKDGIPANQPFTAREKEAVRFVQGVLMTRVKIVQEYLEASPQFEGFWKKEEGAADDFRHSDEIDKPLYALLNPEVEKKIKNDAFQLRVKAANRIAALSEKEDGVKEGQELLIRLRGTFFNPPTDIIEIQNILVEMMDDGDDEFVKKMLEEKSVDDEVTILIARAISQDIISFDAVENQVVKKLDGKNVKLKEISSHYPADERVKLFAQFLISDAGKPLRKDLEKDLAKQPAEA